MNQEKKLAFEQLEILELDDTLKISEDSLELFIDRLKHVPPNIIQHVFYLIPEYPKFIEQSKQLNKSISEIQNAIQTQYIEAIKPKDKLTKTNSQAPQSNQSSTFDSSESLPINIDLYEIIPKTTGANLLQILLFFRPDTSFKKYPTGLHEKSFYTSNQIEKIKIAINKLPPKEQKQILDYIENLLEQITKQFNKDTQAIHDLIDGNPDSQATHDLIDGKLDPHTKSTKPGQIPQKLSPRFNSSLNEHPKTPVHGLEPHSEVNSPKKHKQEKTKIFPTNQIKKNPFKK
jgi:hypothetical protein